MRKFVFCILTACTIATNDSVFIGNIYHRDDTDVVRRSGDNKKTEGAEYHRSNELESNNTDLEAQKDIDIDSAIENSKLKKIRRNFWDWFNGVLDIGKTETRKFIKKSNSNEIFKKVAEFVSNEEKEVRHPLGNGRRQGWPQHLYNNFVLPKLVETNKHDESRHDNFTDVLIKLTQAVNDLNKNLKTQNDNAFLVWNVPKENLKKLRLKRETIASNFQNRNITDIASSSSDLKHKLIDYFKETLDDMKKKIASLASVKDEYYHDSAFKIGYLMATVDILETNITRLRKEMDEKEGQWDDPQIAVMFDTLKEHNKIILELLKSLRFYIEKSKDSNDLIP